MNGLPQLPHVPHMAQTHVAAPRGPVLRRRRIHQLHKRDPGEAPSPGQLEEIPLDELRIRHLQTADEIARVVHLRREIQLPTEALNDPGFAEREKKETSLASSAHSNGAATSSAPSGSSRWDMASPLAKRFCSAHRPCPRASVRRAGK